MKVKMFTLMSGPQGVRKPGKVYSVPDEEAQALIAGGYAEKVESKASLPPVQDEQEQPPAVELPAPEAAVRKSGRKAAKAEGAA